MIFINNLCIFNQNTTRVDNFIHFHRFTLSDTFGNNNLCKSHQFLPRKAHD
jgi:hypothetical protein